MYSTLALWCYAQPCYRDQPTTIYMYTYSAYRDFYSEKSRLWFIDFEKYIAVSALVSDLPILKLFELSISIESHKLCCTLTISTQLIFTCVEHRKTRFWKLVPHFIAPSSRCTPCSAIFMILLNSMFRLHYCYCLAVRTFALFGVHHKTERITDATTMYPCTLSFLLWLVRCCPFANMHKYICIDPRTTNSMFSPLTLVFTHVRKSLLASSVISEIASEIKDYVMRLGIVYCSDA